jgi:N-acetyl-anhydromuramyl-L-alanine amidase AmpD
MIFLKTSKKTEGTNSKEFIILHHTGGGTFKSNCRLLSGDSTQKKDEVSVHYILGEKGFAKTSAHLFLNSDVANGKGGVWGGIFHLLRYFLLAKFGRA